MTPDPITCRADEPLHAIAQRMWDRDVGAVVVVDEDECPVAMITDRDVAMAAYTQGRALEHVRVAVAMSSELQAIRADSSLDVAQRLMQNHRVRRLPVVDQSGRAVGFISLSDLAWYAKAHVTPADVLVTLRALCEPRQPRQPRQHEVAAQ